jgi:hypothetical protein
MTTHEHPKVIFLTSKPSRLSGMTPRRTDTIDDMELLVLGGTAFLGPEIVEAAIITEWEASKK